MNHLSSLNIKLVWRVQVSYRRASDGASTGPRRAGRPLSSWNSSVPYWTNRTLQTHEMSVFIYS